MYSTHRASEISQLSTPHPTPSSVPSSRGVGQRTKGALSPIQRSNGRTSDIRTRKVSAQMIPTVALTGALSGLDAPATLHPEDLELLAEDDVIGDLDFVSILTNRKLSYTQSHSICEPIATPGAVLTDVFRGLREQNAKIIKTLNLLIAAGRKNKTAIADLEVKLGDITAATNTLITSTRSFKADLASTDTNIKATRNHMLLVQDQLKHLTASMNASASGEQKRHLPHSYNIYGRVYGNSPDVQEKDPTLTDKNALTLSTLVGDARSPSPPLDTQLSRCLIMVKNEAALGSHHTPPQGNSTTQSQTHISTKIPNSPFSNTFDFKMTPSQEVTIAAKTGAGKHMPTALQSLGHSQPPQRCFEQSKTVRVPLATPMESMEIREGQGCDMDTIQRLDTLEKNLRQVIKHLGLIWID
ncbi:Hypothetical protein GLP15_2978 [Giardia lamblia P15]|uniref:Uncharacterized protein n=1 Tax=Giardia intestinalis (strain P15) TaxID=658858 RepID=E1EYW6_GIAIA|nr:Hypothetical protein GLP15_2978 [Giardia lamblia P15]